MVLTVLIPHALQVARGMMMMNDDHEHENEKNGGFIEGICLNNKHLLPPPFVTKSCTRIFKQSSFRMMKIKLGEPRSQFDISMW